MRGTQFKWRQSEEQIEERGGRTPPAPRAAGPETTMAFHLGKPIMRTSVGKWERSQNFADKHGTIYCFHIRRRVLRTWMQFVNPLSRVQSRARGVRRRRPPSWCEQAQVTWPCAKDLFSCCWRTNSQISFYRAKGLYRRPIGGAWTEMFSRRRRTQILSDGFMYRKHYTLKTLALDARYRHS